MTDEIGLFEAMHTQRAIRYIKPDPVPDELITRLLEAGTKALRRGQADVAVHRHQGPGDSEQAGRHISYGARVTDHRGYDSTAAQSPPRRAGISGNISKRRRCSFCAASSVTALLWA